MDNSRLKKYLLVFGSVLGTLLAICVLVLICAAYAALQDLQEIQKEIKPTAQQLRSSLAGVAGDSKAIREHLDRDLIVIGAGAAAWQKASKQQAEYWTDTAKKSGETLDAAKFALGTLDASVRAIGVLADHTDFDLNDAGSGAIPAIQNDANRLAEKLSALAESLTILSAHADQVVGNPEIVSTLIAMRGTADDLKASADDLKAKVHQMVKPASLTYRIFTSLLGGATKGAQISMGVR